MTWKPNVTVAAVVEDAGRFLLVEEKVGGRVVFNQPAGHLEPGESLAQAVIRETLEETAWTFRPGALTGVYLYPGPREITYLRFCFAGTVAGHDPARRLDTGILRAVWMTRDEILERRADLRGPMVLRCIDDFLAGRRYPLEMLHDELEGA